MVSGPAFSPSSPSLFQSCLCYFLPRKQLYYLLFAFLFSIYSIWSSNCKNQQQQQLKCGRVLICIQDLGSRSVCWYLLFFSVWEFLLAPVNIPGRVAVNQIPPSWAFLPHSAELYVAHRPFFKKNFCRVQRCSCASGDDAEWITKVPDPLGWSEPHTSLRPARLSEAWRILVGDLQKNQTVWNFLFVIRVLILFSVPCNRGRWELNPDLWSLSALVKALKESCNNAHPNRNGSLFKGWAFGFACLMEAVLAADAGAEVWPKWLWSPLEISQL